jgi:hypothetical protein
VVTIKNARSLAVGAVAASALALTACGGDKADASSSVQQLSSPVHVSGNGSGWNSAKFEGTVNLDAGPVCTTTNGGRVVVFHVRAGADTGAIPTANWLLQTGNAKPVSNENFDLGTFAGPILGSSVDTGHAWGDVAFYLPPKTVATEVQLFSNPETFSSASGDVLAKWATSDDVKPTSVCPASVQSAVSK